MSTERRDVVAEGGSSGKSTPNWSRMEEGGGTERGSIGEYFLWRNLVRGRCCFLMVTVFLSIKHVFFFVRARQLSTGGVRNSAGK